jgi:transposase
MIQHFKATEIAKRFKMNEKTAQRWAKAKDWRKEVYDALQYKMIQELAEQAKEI